MPIPPRGSGFRRAPRTSTPTPRRSSRGPWANLEASLLLRAALASSADEARSSARLFVAVRRARWDEIGADLAAAEAFDEFNEGLAKYTALTALRLAPGSGTSPSARILEDPTFGAYRHAGMMRQAALAGLLTVLEDLTQMRGRGDLMGAAQALLLDRLDPTWRARAFDPPTTLVQLLTRASGFRPEDEPDLLRKAQAEPVYDSLLELAREDYRRILRRREEVLRRFMERPGIRVRLLVPAGDVRNYRYDPQTLADPGGSRLIHEGLLEVDVVGGQFRADGEPAMTVYGMSPPDVREVWFVVAEDASFSLDNSIFYPRLGSMNATQEIRIEAPGLLLEGGPCHLYMSDRTVEVSFNSRPARGSAPGTP